MSLWDTANFRFLEPEVMLGYEMVYVIKLPISKPRLLHSLDSAGALTLAYT